MINTSALSELTVTKEQVAQQNVEAHHVDMLMTLIGCVGIVLSSLGFSHVKHLVLKVALGIVDGDSILLTWWAVQDLYFYYKNKLTA